MKRRAFLRRVAVSVVSAYALVGLPIDVLPQSVKKQAGLEYLRLFHNEFVQHHNRLPCSFVVGHNLFDAVKQELEDARVPAKWELFTVQKPSVVVRTKVIGPELCRSQFPGWKVIFAS